MRQSGLSEPRIREAAAVYLGAERTVISWAENLAIFKDVALAFRLSFANKCDQAERFLVAEYYQRCFDAELDG